MKKLIIAGCSALSIALIAYAIMAPHSKASQGDYSFEYYYNNNTEDNSDISQNTEDNNTDEHTSEKTEYDYNIIEDLGEDNLMSDFDLSEFDLAWNSSEKIHLINSNLDNIAILVNKEYVLPADYVPEDLVEPDVLFSFNYSSDKRLLRQEAATALEELFGAASNEGLTLAGVSGYRSYSRQFEIYAANLIRKGIEYTNQYSAMPGSSEHQTGLSIDISTGSIGYRLDEAFATTPEGKWLESNAHKYGFIIRYPSGKSNITGFSYEPWHIRYVGVELATHLYENDLTLDEYYGYEYSEDIYDNVDYDKIISTYYAMIKPVTTPTPVVTTPPVENTENDDIDEDSQVADAEDNSSDKDNDKDNNKDDSSEDKKPNKPNKKPNKDENKGNGSSNGTTPDKDNSQDKGDKDDKEDNTEVEVTPTPPADNNQKPTPTPEEPSVTPTPPEEVTPTPPTETPPTGDTESENEADELAVSSTPTPTSSGEEVPDDLTISDGN